jgi:hypothetical protein
MNDIQDKLTSLTRDELNMVARKLRIRGYRKKALEILRTDICSLDDGRIRRALSLSWWDRHQSIIGYVGVLASVVALLLAIVLWRWPYNPKEPAPTTKELTDVMQKQLDNLYDRLKSPDTVIKARYPGYSLHLIASLHRIRNQRREYIYDIGNVDRSRLSVYVGEDDSLSFRVLDSAGEPFTLKISGHDFPLDEVCYFVFEVGNRESSSFMRTLVNGKGVSTLELSHVLTLGDFNRGRGTLGADLGERDAAKFDLAELFAYTSTLTTEQQLKLLDYVRTKRRKGYVTFSGDQWLKIGPRSNEEENRGVRH